MTLTSAFIFVPISGHFSLISSFFLASLVARPSSSTCGPFRRQLASVFLL
jgi:hypothetical protein